MVNINQILKFYINEHQNLSSWGFWDFERLNLELRYFFKRSTFLMFASRALSTAT